MNPSSPSPQPKLSAALAAIWQRSRPQVLERLALLEQAAAAHTLPETLRHEAASTAHKLAGTLGMFGFPQGTELARQLEEQFERPHPDPATLNQLTQTLREVLFPEGG